MGARRERRRRRTQGRTDTGATGSGRGRRCCVRTWAPLVMLQELMGTADRQRQLQAERDRCVNNQEASTLHERCGPPPRGVVREPGAGGCSPTGMPGHPGMLPRTADTPGQTAPGTALGAGRPPAACRAAAARQPRFRTCWSAARDQTEEGEVGEGARGGNCNRVG